MHCLPGLTLWSVTFEMTWMSLHVEILKISIQWKDLSTTITKFLHTNLLFLWLESFFHFIVFFPKNLMWVIHPNSSIMVLIIYFLTWVLQHSLLKHCKSKHVPFVSFTLSYEVFYGDRWPQHSVMCMHTLVSMLECSWEWTRALWTWLRVCTWWVSEWSWDGLTDRVEKESALNQTGDFSMICSLWHALYLRDSENCIALSV